MIHEELKPTRHALIRCAQRGIDLAGLRAAVRHGDRCRVGGGRFAFHLGRRAVRRAAAAGQRLEKFERVVVVIVGARIVTAWKSDKSPRRRRRPHRRGGDRR